MRWLALVPVGGLVGWILWKLAVKASRIPEDKR